MSMTLRQQGANVGFHVVVLEVPEYRLIPSPMYTGHCAECHSEVAVSHVSSSVANFVTSQIGCSARDADPQSLSIVTPVRRLASVLSTEGSPTTPCRRSVVGSPCFQIHGTAQEMDTRRSRTAQIRTDAPSASRSERRCLFKKKTERKRWSGYAADARVVSV
jgi:hypothetical protein